MDKSKILNTVKYKDEDGNIMIVDRYEEVSHIKIQIKKERRARKVATVNKGEKRIYFSRTRSRHMIRYKPGYALNKWVLENGQLFDTIILWDDVETWKIPLSDALKGGENWGMVGSGFESQLLFTFEWLEQYKI